MTADVARETLPVVAIVGRVNVGKSTLFNRLTRSRDALVADFPGLTRDRQYGFGKVGSRPYLVVDTGGFVESAEGLDDLVTRQALQAVQEADVVLFLVDGRAGLSSTDQTIVEQLRRIDKPLHLVVNKTEGLDAALACAEFHALGIGEPHPISASHNHGVQTLMEFVLADVPGFDPSAPAGSGAADRSIRLAIIGRPNVGKSTLINRLLGEQRMLAFDQPGTTRDSVEIPFSKEGRHYTLIDTAGVRRRSRVHDTIEKFSVLKTLKAIEQAHVVLMMVDARQGIGDQDATLLGLVLDSGRALVLAVNKWDRLERSVRDQTRRDLERKLGFLDFADLHFISALHGSGVMDLLASVNQAYRAATRSLSTPELTRILQAALHAHQPPMVRGRNIKLRYAHQGGQNPPRIVIHGNRTEHVPASYQRYLSNAFRTALKLRGTPVSIELKSAANPYQTATPKRSQNTRKKAGGNKPGRKR